jgi:hypothetical protein
MAAANEAINHARNDNALAAAPDIVNEAEQKLNQARAAADSGDNTAAVRLANEAKADVELADATAQNMKAQKAAESVHSDITGTPTSGSKIGEGRHEQVVGFGRCRRLPNLSSARSRKTPIGDLRFAHRGHDARAAGTGAPVG